MKNFILNWRRSVEAGVLKEQKNLKEISDEEKDFLQPTIDNMTPENLPLNNLYNGKYRTIIPIETFAGPLAELINAYETASDWKFDLTKGVLTKKYVQEFNGKTYNKVKTLRIGGFISSLEEIIEKLAVITTQRNQLFRDLNDDHEGNKKKIDAIDGKINGLREAYHKSFGIRYPERWEKTKLVEKAKKYWIENAAFFKNNPEEAFSRYSIIISRHPVDVVRMSDFDHITSCHTPRSREPDGPEEWVCAFAEAMNGGGIAYVVKSEDLKDFQEEYELDVETTTEEIFSDEDRGEGEIVPISRIRLRTMGYTDSKGNQVNIGVPEKRLYGGKTPNFLKTLTKWSRDNQEEALGNLPKKEDGKTIDADKINLFGGHYEDTDGTKAIKFLTGEEVEGVVRWTQNGSEEAARLRFDQSAAMAEEFENLVDEWNNRMDYVKAFVEVENYGDGPMIDVWAETQITIEIPYDKQSEEFKEKAHGFSSYTYRSELANLVAMELSDLSSWIAESEGNSSDIDTTYNTYDKSVSLIFQQRILSDIFSGGGVYDEDSLTQFLYDLEENIEDEYDGISGYIYSILVNNEIINDPFSKMWSKIEQDYMEELDDGDWTFDADGDPYLIEEQSIDIEMHDIYFGIEKVKGIPKEYKKEDIIKEIVTGLFFKRAVQKIINKRINSIKKQDFYAYFFVVTRVVFGDTPKVSYTMTVHKDDNVSHIETIIKNISREDMEDIILESYIIIVAEDMKKKGIKGGMFMDDKDFSSPSEEPQDDTPKQQQIPFEKESEKSLNERIHKNWINKLMN